MTPDILKLWEAEADEIVKDWSSFPTDPERDNKRILALIKALRRGEEGLKSYSTIKATESALGHHDGDKAREVLAEIEGILNGNA